MLNARFTKVTISNSFLVLVALSLAACGGSGSSGSSTQVSAPTVTGDTQAAATTAITSAGLTVGTVTQQSSSTVASRRCHQRDPRGGHQRGQWHRGRVGGFLRPRDSSPECRERHAGVGHDRAYHRTPHSGHGDSAVKRHGGLRRCHQREPCGRHQRGERLCRSPRDFFRAADFRDRRKCYRACAGRNRTCPQWRRQCGDPGERFLYAPHWSDQWQRLQRVRRHFAHPADLRCAGRIGNRRFRQRHNCSRLLHV